MIAGVLMLALLTLLPNQKAVFALPFLSPAEIEISPLTGPIGTEIKVEGKYYAPSSTVTITFDGNSVGTSPETILVKNDGKFSAKFIVPDTAIEDGDKTIQVTDDFAVPNSVSAIFKVTGNEAPSNEAEITISPISGPIGTEITVIGQSYAPSSTIAITFDGDSVNTSPETIVVGEDGTFGATFVVPDTATEDGPNTIEATDDSTAANSASYIFGVTGSGSNEDQAKIGVSPPSGPSGTEITVDGQFFTPLSTITITFDGDSVSTSPETISAAEDGTFSAKFIVPDSITEDGARMILATDDSTAANSASYIFGVTGNGGSNEEPPSEPNRDEEAEARSQSVTMNEDNSISIMLKASHQDDSTHFSIVDGPLHGLLNEFESETGTVDYAPNADYFGTDRFTFRVSGSSVLGTVSITVREVNDRPIARDVQVATLEESALQFTLSGSDVDVGDVLTFSILGVPTHGTLSGTAPNLTYLPVKDFDGYDNFRFRTSDGESSSEVANVAIRVNGVNDPPVVEAQTNVATQENDRIRITLMATDIDSEIVSFSIVSGPQHGTLTPPLKSAPHVAMSEYTPNPNYAGQDSFTFAVNDGSQDNGISNTGRVSIMVGTPTAGNSNFEPNLPSEVPAELPPEPSPTTEPSNNPSVNPQTSVPDVLTQDTDSIPDVPVETHKIADPNGPDTIPPTLSVPTKAITLDAAMLMGAMVNYESSANDNVDGAITPHCYPRSGLMFPVGESVVKCTATDKAGNISERSFAVVVHPFKLDITSLTQFILPVALASTAAVVAAILIIRKRRHGEIDKDLEQPQES
jgi:archaellum component FlaF (FlaF/FlaG flagellin family)